MGWRITKRLDEAGNRIFWNTESNGQMDRWHTWRPRREQWERNSEVRVSQYFFRCCSVGAYSFRCYFFPGFSFGYLKGVCVCMLRRAHVCVCVLAENADEGEEDSLFLSFSLFWEPIDAFARGSVVCSLTSSSSSPPSYTFFVLEPHSLRLRRRRTSSFFLRSKLDPWIRSVHLSKADRARWFGRRLLGNVGRRRHGDRKRGQRLRNDGLTEKRGVRGGGKEELKRGGGEHLRILLFFFRKVSDFSGYETRSWNEGRKGIEEW